MNSPAYEKARAAAQEAYHAYRAKADAFQAGEISTEEFSAAQQANQEANDAFDLAYQAECDRPDALVAFFRSPFDFPCACTGPQETQFELF